MCIIKTVEIKRADAIRKLHKYVSNRTNDQLEIILNEINNNTDRKYIVVQKSKKNYLEIRK